MDEGGSYWVIEVAHVIFSTKPMTVRDDVEGHRDKKCVPGEYHEYFYKSTKRETIFVSTLPFLHTCYTGVHLSPSGPNPRLVASEPYLF